MKKNQRFQELLHCSPCSADFSLLLFLFLVFRLLSLFLFRPGGFIRDWSDFDTFLGIAALSDYDLYPFLDFWLEWPPLAPWLMVGAYKISLLLPPWEDHRFWFISILGTVFVLFEVGNFALIYYLARRVASDAATVNRILWLYAGLFPPVYTMLGFFDGLALFFILLSLALLLTRRTRTAAVAIGVGFMTKVTPILMLPVVLKTIWHHQADIRRVIVQGVWIILITAGTILLLATPFLLAGSEWLATFVRALFGRSSWETLWAVWEGYYGFGRVAGDRLNPAEAVFAIHPSVLPWGLITLGFALLYGLIFFLKADFDKPRRMLSFAGLTLSLFLLYSKGYSPQFLVYLLPFIILLLPNLAGFSYALILTLLNVLEQPIYFVFFPPDQFPAETWLLTTIVTARFGVLVFLSFEFALSLGWWPATTKWHSVFQSGMRGLLAVGVVIGLIVVIPNTFSAYKRVQLARSPHHPLITFLQSRAGQSPDTLILTDQMLYRQLYPHLRTAYTLRLVGGALDFPTAPTLPQVLTDEAQVWFLPTGERGETMTEMIRAIGAPLARYQFDPSGTLMIVDLNGTGRPPMPLAQADEGVALISYHLETGPSALTLTLYWQTDRPQETSYTVFTQLLDGSGQLIAGHDSLPAGGNQPTPTWLPGEVVVDVHQLTLPAELTPGTYRLVAGMYDPQIKRLVMHSATDEPFESNAISVTMIEWP